MELTGRVIKKDLREFKKFTKLELVVEYETTVRKEKKKFPVKVEILGKNSTYINEHVEVGDNVKVDFHLEGREWEGKYYNSVIADFVKFADKNVEESDDGLPF